jgi:hypothetical protein
VKEKQPTSAQHMWELLQDGWKSIPGEAGWENVKSVQSCHQGKGLATLKNCWLLHDSICYFIVLMSSLLFYNVENSKKIKKNSWMSTFDWYCMYINTNQQFLMEKSSSLSCQNFSQHVVNILSSQNKTKPSKQTT